METRRKKTKIPRFLKPYLWSYDLKKMDPRDPGDKKVIIRQILNYGDWRTLQWLLKTYSGKDLVLEVKNPSRGAWFKEILDYWIKILDLKIPKKKYRQALLDLKPHLDVFEDYFKPKKKGAF